MTLVKRAGVLALVTLVVTVSTLVGMADCATYITSGANDAPQSGTLIGQSTRTQTTNQSFTSSWSSRIIGGSYTLSRSTTESYSVGTYQMSDGTITQVRCDTYQHA